MGKMEQNTALIFPGPANSRPWKVVNDNVMGGVSKSCMTLTPESVGVFSGRVSLENGGGFASARVDVEGQDLTGRGAVEVEVKGDDKRYQLHLRMTPGPGGVSYRARFETRKEEWLTIRLPFTSFVATFRGREVRDAAPLDPSRIRQLGFLIADGQEGDFRLEISRVAVR